MAKGLSDDQLKAYRSEGCVFPVILMTCEEATEHRRRLEEAEGRQGAMHYRGKPYLIFGSANEIAHHPILLDAVEDILGPDILLWDSAYVIKEAHDDSFVSWHQDLTYWGLDSDQLVTVWVALSPSTAQSGCMRFLPGSHKAGMMRHSDSHAEQNILHRGQTIADGIDETGAIDIVLQPGQASLHHGWVCHASNANTSTDRRIGLTMQYIKPSVKQTILAGEGATLVRGQDRHNHFNEEPAFNGDFLPEMVAIQQAAERLKHDVYDSER